MNLTADVDGFIVNQLHSWKQHRKPCGDVVENFAFSYDPLRGSISNVQFSFCCCRTLVGLQHRAGFFCDFWISRSMTRLFWYKRNKDCDSSEEWINCSTYEMGLSFVARKKIMQKMFFMRCVDQLLFDIAVRRISTLFEIALLIVLHSCTRRIENNIFCVKQSS